MPTALITGASSGIGADIARELAKAHHDVVLVARTETKLEQLATELRSAHGVQARVIAADLTAPDAAAALAAQLADTEVDVLVNNAGFGDFGLFATADAAKVGQMIQLNVTALTELTRAFLPAMIARKHGRIVNLGSTAGFMPGPLMAVYYATKAYVLSFGEALANEVSGTGVTVTTVCPGPVESNFQAGASLEDSKLVKGKTIMSSATCARIAVAGALRGKPVVVVGFSNKLQALSPRFLPRRLVPGIVRRAQAPAH